MLEKSPTFPFHHQNTFLQKLIEFSELLLMHSLTLHYTRSRNNNNLNISYLRIDLWRKSLLSLPPLLTSPSTVMQLQTITEG